MASAAGFDIAVVGLGAMGSAVLYQLGKRGVRAVGIDRFLPPHDRGSSHGETRVTRRANGEGEPLWPAGRPRPRDLAQPRGGNRRRAPGRVRRPDHRCDRRYGQAARQDRLSATDHGHRPAFRHRLRGAGCGGSEVPLSAVPGRGSRDRLFRAGRGLSHARALHRGAIGACPGARHRSPARNLGAHRRTTGPLGADRDRRRRARRRPGRHRGGSLGVRASRSAVRPVAGAEPAGGALVRGGRGRSCGLAAQSGVFLAARAGGGRFFLRGPVSSRPPGGQGRQGAHRRARRSRRFRAERESDRGGPIPRSASGRPSCRRHLTRHQLDDVPLHRHAGLRLHHRSPWRSRSHPRGLAVLRPRVQAFGRDRRGGRPAPLHGPQHGRPLSLLGRPLRPVATSRRSQPIRPHRTSATDRPAAPCR